MPRTNNIVSTVSRPRDPTDRLSNRTKTQQEASATTEIFDDRFEKDGSRVLDMMAAALTPNSANRKALTTWLELLEQIPDGEATLGVNTHAALVFLRRLEIGDQGMSKSLEKALRQSWERLTGAVPEDIGARLPRRVLANASRDERDIHAAAFQTRKKSSDAHLDANLLQDYTPEARDLGYALLAVALAMTEVGADALTGGVVGLMIATFGESLLHDVGGHPRAKMRKWSHGPGYLPLRFRQAALGHLTAHHRTFSRDYGEMFESEEEKAKLDTKLEQLKAADPDLDIDIVKEEGYGLTVSSRKMPAFAQPYVAAATVAALAGAALGFDVSTVGVMTLYAFSVLPPFASKMLHPHLHKSRKKALEEAHPLMRRLLESRMVELVDKLHFGHHRGRGGNFNLVTPLGDLMRGQLRLPTVKELLALRESKKWPRAPKDGA